MRGSRRRSRVPSSSARRLNGSAPDDRHVQAIRGRGADPAMLYRNDERTGMNRKRRDCSQRLPVNSEPPGAALMLTVRNDCPFAKASSSGTAPALPEGFAGRTIEGLPALHGSIGPTPAFATAFRRLPPVSGYASSGEPSDALPGRVPGTPEVRSADQTNHPSGPEMIEG